MANDALEVLAHAIAIQRNFIRQWRRPVEPLLFETVRAIDYIFCRELFTPIDEANTAAAFEHSLKGWGTNQALATMIGDELSYGPFRLFRSADGTQRQADELLFQCGLLLKAELLHGWLSEGLVTATLDVLPHRLPSGTEQILVVKSKHASLFHEVVSLSHRKWMCDLVYEYDQHWEKRLESAHFEMLPELVARVEEFQGWGISYSSTEAIDRYFLEWGQVYLRRMWSQDLVGLDEKIGGNQFNEYLGVLAALSGRAQKHLCFAAMLKRRNPQLDIRNLLTSFAPCNEFVVSLASHLDADTLQIQKLLSNLTLEPSNRDAHTNSADTTWAPIVRGSHDHYILPLYGLEINPFLFLLRDLKHKFPRDWSTAANNREKRWHVDLRHLFRSKRWITSGGSVKLVSRGKIVTDVDFVAYDSETNELALFQLKWQHPVGLDNRARRSIARNLVGEGNKWVEAVHQWLSEHGLEGLMQRMGLIYRPGLRAEMFVIGRYNALFSGFSDQDRRAVWADWNHFMRVRVENPSASFTQLTEIIREQIASIVLSLKGESYAFPLGDLAVLLNPTSEPTHHA